MRNERKHRLALCVCGKGALNPLCCFPLSLHGLGFSTAAPYVTRVSAVNIPNASPQLVAAAAAAATALLPPALRFHRLRRAQKSSCKIDSDFRLQTAF